MKTPNTKAWIKTVNVIKKGLRMHEEATKFKTVPVI